MATFRASQLMRGDHYRHQLEDLTEERDQALEDLDEANDRAEDAESALQALSDRVLTCNQTIHRADRKITKLRQNLSIQTEKVGRLRNERDELHDKLDQRKARLLRMKEEMMTLKEENERLRRKIDSLEHQETMQALAKSQIGREALERDEVAGYEKMGREWVAENDGVGKREAVVARGVTLKREKVAGVARVVKKRGKREVSMADIEVVGRLRPLGGRESEISGMIGKKGVEVEGRRWEAYYYRTIT